jgi:hypothetical protein
VNNGGPSAARNVIVNVRAVAFSGTQFVDPADWTAVDSTHIQPTTIHATFPNLPVGAPALAKFSLSSAQIETIYSGGWHSCILANVQSDNDYGTGAGVHVWENNNLAQLNFTIKNAPNGSSESLPSFCRFDSTRRLCRHRKDGLLTFDGSGT